MSGASEAEVEIAHPDDLVVMPQRDWRLELDHIHHLVVVAVVVVVGAILAASTPSALACACAYTATAASCPIHHAVVVLVVTATAASCPCDPRREGRHALETLVEDHLGLNVAYIGNPPFVVSLLVCVRVCVRACEGGWGGANEHKS